MKKDVKKLGIVFKSINEAHVNRMRKFYLATVEIAQIKVNLANETKPIKEQIAKTIERRNKAIDSGLSIEEASVKHNTIELERKLAKLQNEAKTAIQNQNVIIMGKDRKTDSGVKVRDMGSYDMIPSCMYDHYVKYIAKGKSGDFRNSIRQWLYAVCGIDFKENSKEVNKCLELFTARIGAKKAKCADIVSGGSLTVSMKEKAFKDIFLSVWVDILRDGDVM